MKELTFNIFYNSQLKRWADGLLPFDFNINQIPGAKLGLANYIFPNQIENQIYKEL